MTTTESNKLIANFMDLEFVLTPEFGREGKWRLTNSPYSKIFTQSHAVYLDFDNSWAWLMPVVEKIDSLDFVTDFKIGKHITEVYARINDNDYFSKGFTHENRLSRTYYAVVEFIQWHNQSKQQLNN